MPLVRANQEIMIDIGRSITIGSCIENAYPDITGYATVLLVLFVIISLLEPLEMVNKSPSSNIDERD